MEAKNINLTPNPRILLMLGQIDFDNWQCIAELVDNSADALLKYMKYENDYKGEIRVDIPTYSQYTEGKPITIWDNGPGMTVEELENALRAGFSGKDPISNLGLFGMGFNISTARMGDKTTVYSSRKGDEYEIGIEIDFQEMIQKNSYDRPTQIRPKNNINESGTTIKIFRLKERVAYLGQQGLGALRNHLSRVYSKLLRDYKINIYINGQKLMPARKCIWSPERFVEKSGEKIYSFMEINQDIGDMYYCNHCWNWLDTPIQSGEVVTCKICDSSKNVVIRERVIKGWLGVQRFYDMEDYGIDIYRNGRLITSKDKSLFSWENPQTGEMELEYPIDAMFLGGRIVGELEANFLKVNYTKDSFEKSDKNWKSLVEKVRGIEPLRPEIGKRMGYPDNNSILALLYKGYKLGKNPGLANLVPGKYSHSKEKWEVNNVEPKAWAELFYKGDPDYQDDSKWWDLVIQVEEDRRSSPKAKETKSWDPTDPFANPQNPSPNQDSDTGTDDKESQQEKEDKENSHSKSHVSYEEPIERDDKLSNTYIIDELGEEAILVDVFKSETLPDEKPLMLQMLSHSNYKAIYNPNCELFCKYTNSIKEVLFMELANSLYLRKNEPEEWPISRIFYSLKTLYCKEEALDVNNARERTNKLLFEIKNTLSSYLISLEPEIDLIKDDMHTLQRAIINKLGEGDKRLREIIKTTEFIKYMPNNYIKKFFKEYPALFFDGAIWKVPYNEISDEIIRNEIIEEFSFYLSDIIWIIEHEDEEIVNNLHRLRRNIGSLKVLEELTRE